MKDTEAPFCDWDEPRFYQELRRLAIRLEIGFFPGVTDAADRLRLEALKQYTSARVERTDGDIKRPERGDQERSGLGQSNFPSPQLIRLKTAPAHLIDRVQTWWSISVTLGRIQLRGKRPGGQRDYTHGELSKQLIEEFNEYERRKAMDPAIKPLTPREEYVVRALLSCGPLKAMTGEKVINYIYDAFNLNMDLSTLNSAVIPALRLNGIAINTRKGAGYYIADPRVREYLARAFPPVLPARARR